MASPWEQDEIVVSESAPAARPAWEMDAIVGEESDIPVSPSSQNAAPAPFIQPVPQNNPSILQRINGASEVAQALLTGATTGTARFIGGGLRGIGQQILTGDFSQEAGQRSQEMALAGMKAGTYEPQSPEGRRQLAATGEFLEPLAALAPFMPEAALIGEAAQASRPTVAAAVQSARELPAVKGVSSALNNAIVDRSGQPSAGFQKALKEQGLQFENVIDDVSAVPENSSPKQAVDAIIKKKIERGDTDDALATKEVEAITGKVIDDDIAAEAIRQGFRPGDVQAVKAASPGTAQKMQQMLNIRRATLNNERKAMDMRPTDVVGDSLLQRFTYIRKTADQARKDLDVIANKELAGKPINVDSVANNFFKELDDLDVEYSSEGGRPKINFTGSIISKDRASQRVIQDIADLLAEPKEPDALRAHKLKRQLDALIDFEKKANGGLTESGRNVAKSMRASLNNAIREVSPGYAEVNDVLSRSLGSMNEFERVLGPSINIWDEGANKAIGQDLRGLMSNRKSRVRLENSVNDIDKLARELGGEFDDNLADLALFAKTLDDQFGASARTSFAGEIESATGRAFRGDLKGAAIDRMAQAASKKVGEMRNINDQQAFKAMDAVIKRRIKPKNNPPVGGLPATQNIQ